MSWSMILSRMWRSRREMLMLLTALSLVTGFFALSPLYLRVLGESGLRYTVDNARPRDLTLTLTSETPFDLTDRPLIGAELGEVASRVESLTVMNGLICNDQRNTLCFGDDNFHGFVPAAYERLTERFTVVDGTFPSAEGEAAIALEAAETRGLAVGDTLDFYPNTADALTVTIVGILEPIAPDDRFWIGQHTLIYGQLVDVTENFQRFDFGVIFTEAAYNTQVVPIAPSGTRYDWYVETNTDALRAAGLTSLSTALDNVERAFRLDYPTMRLVGGLPPLLATFQTNLLAVEGTVILFAAGVLVLLFYQLMTTTALILERQSLEWSAISSRGGSAEQLITMQAGTMAILALAAFAIGVVVAVGIVFFIGRFSPLSVIIGDGLAVTTIPPLSIALSAAAALVAVIVLTIPAIPAARASILRLKQSVSRPPTTPVWARYYLDVVLLALGVILLLRLYFLFGGVSLEELLTDPSLLIRTISANAAHDAGLLNDPFNLAAAALLITGLALFWLRLFPLIMRGVSALLSRINGLLAPLALWNISRDPGHYAQLVMVLIGTLAIGTASLALAATHDAGAWSNARYAVGGEVALTFDGQAPPAENLPGNAELLMRYETIEPEGSPRTELFGITPERFTELTGETLEDVRRPGIPLPDDTVEITVQVYAEPIAGETVSTRLALDVVNALGVRRTIPMTTADETAPGAFFTYSAALPDEPFMPFTLVGVRFLSRIGSQGLEHVVFLDSLTVVLDNGEQVVLDDFERSTVPEWSSRDLVGVFGANVGVFAASSQSHAASGNYALRVEYAIAHRGISLFEPVLPAYPVEGSPPMPVILSDAYARTLGSRAQRRPLAVGDTGTVALVLNEGTRELRFRVVGIEPAFPNAGNRFLIAPVGLLRDFLNAEASPAAFYGVNTAWLTLRNRQLDPAARDQIAALPGLLDVRETWDLYNLLLREPLPNGIIGVLYAGFWVSLLLGLLDFGFYLAMTAARRATSFAVLRALGWRGSRVWGLLTIEQAALVAPALAIGVLLGGALAYLLLPFLALFGDETLRFPLTEIGGLLLALVIGFAVLLTGAASVLAQIKVGQVLRSGEE